MAGFLAAATCAADRGPREQSLGACVTVKGRARGEWEGRETMTRGEREREKEEEHKCR